MHDELENEDCIDSRLNRRTIHEVSPEDGGYQVTFEGCRHVAWFAVHPGRTAYCSACVYELTAAIRQGADVGPVTPREFLIAHTPRIAQVQRDAQQMIARDFVSRYGITPNEYQRRVRGLKQLAANHASGDAPEIRETMRILLMTWSRQ